MRAGGRRFRGRALEVRIGPADTNVSRVGVVVPRHGRTAVARNLVKRRLREIVRRDRIGSGANPPADFVVIALPRAYDASFVQLREELLALCGQAGQ